MRDKKGRPVVVVTGMGIVSPLGCGKDDNWKRLTAGESGIRSITRFSTEGLRTTISGAVDHVYEPGMVSSELSEKLARLAGNEAIEQSGIANGDFPGPVLSRLPADRDRMVAALRAGRRLGRERQDRICRSGAGGGQSAIRAVL